MSKAEDRSKSKEERLEEKEKVNAEIQRSYAVAEMKKAHGLIEETEKSRKRPILQSICQRIDYHMQTLSGYMEMLNKFPFAESKIFSDSVLIDIRGLGQVHESIRFDFQKNMEIGDDEMNRLFPKIEIAITSGFVVGISLVQIVRQLRHMRLYCERMLSARY